MDPDKIAIAQQVAALSPSGKKTFLNELKRKGLKFERLPIVARKVRGASVCSPAQSRQWFLWQVDKESSAYHIPFGLKLRGRLDRRALSSSFTLLVDRHEALRTVFRAVRDADVDQVVRPAGELKISWIDLGDLPEAEKEERAAAHASGLRSAPFDLTKGPLIRVAVIRLSTEEHLLMVVMHHIVSDGWSMQIIVDEFVELYRASVEGREPKLKPLSIQYADYAVWHRSWLEAGEQERQLAYWKNQLGDEHPILRLATDYPRPLEPKYRTAKHSFELPGTLIEGLQRQAREHHATLFVVLLAGFQALLYRYTGQTDVRVGTTNANRSRAETQGVVGFFVNTQVLRSQVDGRMSLSSLLDQVREAVVGAQEHQDLPFEQLVEALQPQRDGTHQPLFQVLMDHQRSDYRSLRTLPGVTLERYMFGEQGALFELWVNTVERSDGQVSVRLSYARELFEAETIERLGDHYRKVLTTIANRPLHRIGEIGLLSDAEHTQLRQWGANEDHSSTEPVHRMIERQAQTAPEATALMFGEATLSYRELNCRANRLAHRLIALGVRPETRVGIAVERSLEMVVGLLGILKAGGAYVPLDPEYPAERLSYMMRDSGIVLLLTQAGVAGRLPSGLNIDSLEIETLDVSAEPERDPDVFGHPDYLAYVIYTSGSTGVPKGVAVTHGALSNFLLSMRNLPGLRSDDVLLAVTSISFDIAGLELYLPLIAGARIILATEAHARDGYLLRELLQKQQVTVMQATPSSWRLLLAVEQGGLNFGGLRAFCGGEALPPDLARQLSDLRVELWNMYGPTETTIWSSTGRVGASPPTLGRPIASTQLRVLDVDLQDILGGWGELYIGGAGLARGYWNRASLSADRFIADPFSRDGGRLYRTGDRVRWRRDGQLEYLGRIDHQVKMRGFRIELGEIETQLQKQTEVREAAVIARDYQGGPRLLAYVVPDTSTLGRQGTGTEVYARDELVTQWESVFDDTYESESSGPNFRGWSSSYTDQPIPDEQMKEWLQGTVNRISALRPQRILEIGCGVGLLVQHLAPQASKYVGTDLSGRAVKDLRSWVSSQPALSHVELRQAEATDFAGMQPGEFDTVVLNSVVQYLPDVDYLLEVLKGASQLIGSRGRLFIGDLRHLAHVPMFHTSVQLLRASSQTTVRQLRNRVARAVAQDKELVLDPGFFHALAAHLGMGSVEILLKRGKFANELMDYRYDVVIHQEYIERPSPERFDGTQVAAVERLASHLSAYRPVAVTLPAVANRRLGRDLAVCRLIEASEDRTPVGEVLRRLEGVDLTGIDPEELWVLADAYGYQLQISWSSGADGSFEAQFVLPSAVTTRAATGACVGLPERWRGLASDPARALLLQQLGPQLRERLSQVLPDYMVPAHVTVLENLPLTTNGKLDRKALPEPEYNEAGDYQKPEGEDEEALAAIWSEVLGFDRIGRHDNFFELGGHSLLMARVLARVREHTALLGDLTLADMMQRPTISGLISPLRGFATTRGMSHSIVRLNAAGHLPPLFCIHQADGAIFSYSTLARALGGQRTVFGIACRAFLDLSHRDTSAVQMAQDYAALIRMQQPEGPYLLLGHSSGGLLGSLIAHVLEAEGDTVAFLGLVDTYVPTKEGPTLTMDMLTTFINYLRIHVPHAYGYAQLSTLALGSTESMASNPLVINVVERLIHENRERSQFLGKRDKSLNMSAAEIVKAFVIHDRMYWITVASSVLPVLKVAPHCWWSKGRPIGDRISLEQQVGQLAMEREIDADHSSIIRSPDFIADCSRILSCRSEAKPQSAFYRPATVQI